MSVISLDKNFIVVRNAGCAFSRRQAWKWIFEFSWRGDVKIKTCNVIEGATVWLTKNKIVLITSPLRLRVGHGTLWTGTSIKYFVSRTNTVNSHSPPCKFQYIQYKTPKYTVSSTQYNRSRFRMFWADLRIHYRGGGVSVASSGMKTTQFTGPCVAS